MEYPGDRTQEAPLDTRRVQVALQDNDIYIPGHIPGRNLEQQDSREGKDNCITAQTVANPAARAGSNHSLIVGPSQMAVLVLVENALPTAMFEGLQNLVAENDRAAGQEQVVRLNRVIRLLPVAKVVIQISDRVPADPV